MIEFLFDTTRAVVNLILNGTVARYPDIDIIVPHAGATLPVIADRVAAFSRVFAPDPALDVLRDLGRLHFDLAGFPIPRQLDALLTITTLEHLHYGSDWPFTPEVVVTGALERLDGCRRNAPRQHRTTLPRPHGVNQWRRRHLQSRSSVGRQPADREGRR